METVGSIQVVATINTKGYDDGKKHIEKGNNDLEKGSDNASSKMSKAWAIAGAAVVATATASSISVGNIIKSSVAAFADFEQLVGGVETLFKDNANDVIKNSERAYKTAGLSANKYMETVTSFSASLLQGLGGDTKKASAVADRAITDMADNANKMGTSIESIQFAYQGFAKDNFTMLDNLKLGYGGTAGEMARLVNESGVMGKSFKATAENVKDIPFDKLIESIGVVQDRMGITGTTAKEASETISGSFSSLKGAWQNVLTGMADPSADMNKLVKELISSGRTYANNVLPAINTATRRFGIIMYENIPPLRSTVDFISENRKMIIALGAGVIATTVAWKGYQLTLVTVAGIKATVTAASIAMSTVLAIQAQGVGILRAAWIALNLSMAANPIGMVIAVVAGLIAVITTLAILTARQNAEEKRLEEQRRMSITIANNLKTAEDNLSGARKTAEGAALNVERAQRTLNETTARYGANSLEAREASYNLRNAQDELKKSQDKVKDATNEVSNAVSAQKTQMDDLKQRLDNMNGKSFTYYVNGVEHVAQDYGKKGKFLTPTFATGGFTGRGGKYDPAGIVHKGEYVVPKQYVNQSTGLPNISGGTEYNIQNINISSEVDGDRWLRRLTNNTEIESSGLVPTQRYA